MIVNKKHLSNFLLFLTFSLPFFVQADVNSVFDNIPVQIANQSKVYTLVDNNEAWVAKWELVSRAKSSIYIDFFTIGKDIYGRAFLGLLLKKAREGIPVVIMTDGLANAPEFGYGIATDYFQELLRNPNIKIRYYNRLTARLMSGLSGSIAHAVASNHDKFLVVDSRYCITGGRNIAFDYYADPVDFPAAWRDSDIYIESLVSGLEFKLAFVDEFINSKNMIVRKDPINFASKEDDLMSAYEAMEQWIYDGEMKNIGGSKKFLALKNKNFLELKTYKMLAGVGKHFSILNGIFRGDVKVLDKLSALSKKHDLKNEITPSLIQMIDASENQIIIQNPYVILTKDFFEALKRAHDRNVEIILHTNSPLSTDSLITQAYFIDQWPHYMKDLPNIKIYAFVKNRKMHSKIFIFDRMITAVGSYNMDTLSQNINSEIAALVRSSEMAEQVAGVIQTDINDSLELTADPNIRENSPMVLATPEMKKKILKALKYKKVLQDYV